jgi:hypothetical protein
VNLYPEPNPKDAPFPVSHYPAPGLYVQSDYTGTFSGYVRGIYQASNGAVIAVIGQSVIKWNGGGNSDYVLLGTLASNSGYPVSICDNQTDVVLVDGTANGYYAPLAALTAGSLQPISDPAFYGSSRVDYIDTFLIFNWPGTPTFYTTTSNALTPFNPLYFAGKEGWNDYLVCVAALHDNIWLLGNSTAEIWFNSGAPDFPWQRMPSSILQQGCVSFMCVVIADNALYWLSQDRWGRNMMMRGQGFGAQRVSNFAVENEWSTYPTLADAIGMAYQIGGHETVGIYFPSGNAWWAFDASTQMWHKRTYGDLSTPWLPYCTAGLSGVSQVIPFENMVLAGDRTGPRILQIHPRVYTDAGTTIIRQRAWPHSVDDGNRVHYPRFTAAIDGSQLSPDGITLDWSDDGGNTFGTPLTQDAQSNPWSVPISQYQWRRLGYARDRVFRLTWSGQGEATLNGAWIDVVKSAT